MPHKLLAPLLAAVFLAAPAVFAPATMTSLSGSALAQKTPTTDSTTINSTKSHTFRTKQTVRKNNKLRYSQYQLGTMTRQRIKPTGIAVGQPGAPSDKLGK